jgi:hypothetical protein
LGRFLEAHALTPPLRRTKLARMPHDALRCVTGPNEELNLPRLMASRV